MRPELAPRQLAKIQPWEYVIRFAFGGAVTVLTGNFIYFDNAKEKIEPDHIMASGALPPALPMMKIGSRVGLPG